MGTEFVIRRAHTKDIADIVNTENASFGIDKFSRSQFMYLVNKSKGVFYVAVTGEKTAGYICMLLHSRRRNMRIYSLAVLPEYRSKGIAGALISKAKEFALNKNKNVISLEVHMDNLSAIKLYERNGFQISSIKRQYYSDLADAFYMQFVF